MRLILGTILFRSLSAIFAKKAALVSAGQGIERIVVNIWTGAEFTALIFQAILWSHVLNKYPLNRVYPFMSLVFVANLVAARIFFQEVVLLKHIIGTGIILLGIIVNSKGRFRSSHD